MVFGVGAFGMGLGNEAGVLTNGISDFIKETPESSAIPSTTWGYSKKTAMFEPESRPSSDPELPVPGP